MAMSVTPSATAGRGDLGLGEMSASGAPESARAEQTGRVPQRGAEPDSSLNSVAHLGLGAPVSWDVALLAALIVPYFMTYTGPVMTLVLLAFGSYVLAHIFVRSPSRRNRLKLGLLLLIILVGNGFPLAASILARQSAEGSGDLAGVVRTTHDGAVLQTEAAMEYLLSGRNPYIETYNSAVALYEVPGYEVNPAVEHYIYLPFAFLSGLPVYVALEAGLGAFDQRLVYGLSFLALLLLLPLLASSQDRRLALLIGIGLGYFPMFHLPYGANDYMILTLLVLATYVLARGHPLWASAVVALACATKQTAWPFVPFFLVVQVQAPVNRAELERLLRLNWPLAAVSAAVVLPFLVWDAPAFWDDVIGYPTGTSATSYAIRGPGLGSVLTSLGLIAGPRAYFPFWILQLAVGLPLLVICLRWMSRAPSLRRCWLGYSLLLFAVVVTGRYTLEYHLSYLAAALLLGLFVDADPLRKPPGFRPGAATAEPVARLG